MGFGSNRLRNTGLYLESDILRRRLSSGMYKACPGESGTDKFMQRFI